MARTGRSRLKITVLCYCYAALISAFASTPIFGQAEATNANWRKKVIGTILGPTCTRLDGQALEPPTPPTKHELLMLIQKLGARKFVLPDDWQFVDAQFELVESWLEVEKHYPLIGPAQLEHRLHKCTVRYRSESTFATHKFVIDHNRFIVTAGGGAEHNDAGKRVDDWKPIANRRLRAYPKLRSYDDIAEMPTAPKSSWPDFFQGGWVARIEWVVDGNGEKRQVSNPTSCHLLVSENYLFLYHSLDASLCAYELLACDATVNDEGRQICLTHLNKERRMLELSENELVMLSHGPYSMMGYSLSKIPHEVVEDNFQLILQRTAFLLDGKIIRFCGEDVKQLESALDDRRDRNAVNKLQLQLDNPDIKSVTWFRGSASQEALLRKILFEPGNSD